MLDLIIALSLHVGLKEDYNEVHPHIRYTHDDIITGVYYNSEKEISAYVGHRWEKYN